MPTPGQLLGLAGSGKNIKVIDSVGNLYPRVVFEQLRS